MVTVGYRPLRAIHRAWLKTPCPCCESLLHTESDPPPDRARQDWWDYAGWLSKTTLTLLLPNASNSPRTIVRSLMRKGHIPSAKDANIGMLTENAGGLTWQELAPSPKANSHHYPTLLQQNQSSKPAPLPLPLP